MFDHIPYGTAPKGKSKYLFTDHPRMWENKSVSESAEIFYACNTDGYREREWSEIDWDNFILFLGDSFTFGLGARQRETIPFYVENKTNICCVNLSIPGANLELITQLSLIVKEKAKPKAVILQYPHLNRLYDPIESNYHGNLGNWVIEYPDVVPRESKQLYHAWIADRSRALTNLNFYSKILRYIWKDDTCLEWTSYRDPSKYLNIPTLGSEEFNANDLARDGIHLGKRKNKHLAAKIVTWLEKENIC